MPPDTELVDDAPALELVAVRAGYGAIEVLSGIDFAVPAGSVFALLGPNGAGKTTTLRVISGQLRPTSGCVHIGGVHMNGVAPDVLARAGVCSIPEGRGVFPNLTVAENLAVFGMRRWRRNRTVEEQALEFFPELAPRRSQLAGTLSGGEQQMLALARALTSQPSVILLDEISMGLAPRIVAQLYEVVRRLAATGISIVLVEQFAATALAAADYVAIMQRGVIMAIGEPADVEAGLAAAYLGGAA